MMKTKRLKLLPDINSTETDYKAEVIAAGLSDAGRREDRVLIVRHGGNRKEVAKDISKTNTEFSGLDMTEYLYIYTNRYGIYDSLPEGVFQLSTYRGKGKSRQDVIGEIRARRVEEFHARRFFQPFEMGIDRMLIDTQVYEQQFDKAHTCENLKIIFEEHWDILQYLSEKQVLLFLRIIPLIPECGRDFEMMASLMCAILSCPVKIVEGKTSSLELAENERSTLRNMKLGVNSVMGKAVKTDFADLEIIIGPTGAEQVRDFQADKNNRIILQKLIGMILPFDRKATVRYEVFADEKKFRLSGQEHKAYLGVNTAL